MAAAESINELAETADTHKFLRESKDQVTLEDGIKAMSKAKLLSPSKTVATMSPRLT